MMKLYNSTALSLVLGVFISGQSQAGGGPLLLKQAEDDPSLDQKTFLLPPPALENQNPSLLEEPEETTQKAFSHYIHDFQKGESYPVFETLVMLNGTVIKRESNEEQAIAHHYKEVGWVNDDVRKISHKQEEVMLQTDQGEELLKEAGIYRPDQALPYQEKDQSIQPLMGRLTYKEGQPFTLLKISKTWQRADQSVLQEETEQEIPLNSTFVGWHHYAGYSRPKVSYRFTFNEENKSIEGVFEDASKTYTHQTSSPLSWQHDDKVHASRPLTKIFFMAEGQEQVVSPAQVRPEVNPTAHRLKHQGERYQDQSRRTYEHPNWVIPEYQRNTWQRPDNTEYEEALLLQMHRENSGVATEHTEERLTSANNSECVGSRKHKFHSPTFFYKVYNYYTTYKWTVTTFGNGTQEKSPEVGVSTRKVEVGNYCTH